MHARFDLRRLLAGALLLAACGAQAGQACADRPLTPSEVVRSMDLAQRTVQALDGRA